MKFIILHQNKKPIAFNIECISDFRDYCIQLKRSRYFEYDVDESFDEIKKKLSSECQIPGVFNE